MLIKFTDIEENVKPQKSYDAGIYEVQVVKAEEGHSKSGTPHLFVEFETKGDVTFNVKHWFYQTPKALSILLNFLGAIGIYDKNSKEDLNYNPEDVIGARLKVEFEKDSDGKYLQLKPWSCEAVSGITTKKVEKKVEVVDDSEIPF